MENKLVSEPSKIEDIQFLVSAKVFLKTNGQPQEEMVYIDLVGRKVYDNSLLIPDFSEKVFEYLDSVNILPENLFEASPDVYREAEQAQYDHSKMNADLGENNVQT
jgi:hypothetical protein